jgi:hypothetical protein
MGRELVLAATGVLTLLAFGASSIGAERIASKPAVLVELFTSEGCSSCPPADRLLADLLRTQPLAGAEIIALSEHVDYWNRLGWTDPFSSADFSRRQSDYAGVLATHQVYTPQMVVDGRFEFIGSDAHQARQAIEMAARQPKADMTVVFSRTAAENSAALEVRVANLPDDVAGPMNIWLAVTEDDLETDIVRGENAGKRLKHAAVVRRLQKVAEIAPKRQAPLSWSREVRLESAWKPSNLRAVVFLQERDSRRIVGVAAAGL